jgi:hypothetical protein
MPSLYGGKGPNLPVPSREGRSKIGTLPPLPGQATLDRTFAESRLAPVRQQLPQR